jgi:hypothetical protein
MAGTDEGVWRTLARLYTAILACGVCVPPVTALPLLVGIDSLFVLLASGAVGLGIASVVIYLLDAQIDAYGRLDPHASDPAADTVSSADETADSARA